MFYGFNVKLNDSDFEKLKIDLYYNNFNSSLYRRFETTLENGNKALCDDRKSIENNLEKYIGVDGAIDANSLENDWFPNVDIDVFLSHSHKDRDKALILSELLKEKFGLNVFIDSCVWGNSDDLLKKIDDKYCKNPNSKSYNYEKRNKTTSYVHLLLNGALMKMINRSKCVMFLNTSNSLSIKNTVSGDNTSSPWIYSELLMTNIILEKQSIISHSEEAVFDASFEFPVELEKLIDTSIYDLKQWFKNTNLKKDDAILKLYQIAKK